MITLTQGEGYAQWALDTKSLGGVATVWPFSDSYRGQPAARFDAATFAALVNAGQLSTSGTQATTSGAWVYVLASAMTGDNQVVQDASNFVQPTPDEEAAAAAASPSTGEQLVKEVLVGVAGIVALAVVLRSVLR